MDNSALTLDLEPTPASLLQLRSTLQAWLEAVDVDEVARADITLACWEAAVNAVEHPLDPVGPVQVEALRAPDRVEVRIANRGRWRTRTEPRPERGLGLRLIGALMDGVEVVRSTTETQIRMQRYLARPRATSTA